MDSSNIGIPLTTCHQGRIRQASKPVAAHDPVDHPSHYTFGNYEVIDVIEDWKLGYHLGNAVKYIARAGKKDSLLQDLRKARWYLDRRIDREVGKIVEEPHPDWGLAPSPPTPTID